MGDVRRVAIVRGGVVHNVVVVDEDLVPSIFSGEQVVVLPAGERAGPGWSYDGASFVEPPPDPPDGPPAEEP